MRTSSVEVRAKRCPQCGTDALVLTRRYPVLAATTESTRTGTEPHDGTDRLRYEAAWVCENPRCHYREIIGDQ
jgi:hypothetical protein